MPGGVPPDKAEGTLMNYRMVWQVLGRVLCIEAALMILPMVTALCYGETPLPFLISAAATVCPCAVYAFASEPPISPSPTITISILSPHGPQVSF